MAVEFIRQEVLTKMDGKKLLEVFCLMSILMTIGIDAAFPDLSKIYFAIGSDLDGNVEVQLYHRVNAEKVQVSCGGCQQNSNINQTNIPCELNSFLTMTIGIVMGGRQYDIPLNVTCGGDINVNKMTGLNATYVDSRSAFLSWDKLDGIDNYVAVVMDETVGRLMKQNGQLNIFHIANLAERTPYQVCMATVDRHWRTSQYACVKFETDFATTGPVENARAMVLNDSAVIVTWKEPLYRLDRPQGYSVTISDQSGNSCRVFDISINDSSINFDTLNKCAHVKLQWKELRSLLVDRLSPYSNYSVAIRPFNRDRPANVTALRVQTEDGESESVSSIKVEKYNTTYSLVSFNVPDKPNGIIRSYRIRIYLTKDSICQQANEQMITETNIIRTHAYFDAGMIRPCRKYRVEAVAVNRWRKNGGVGRPSSVNYTHQSVQIPAVVGEFVTSNQLRLSWSNGESLCDNSVMVVTVRNSVEQSSCVTYVVSDRICEGIKQVIPSDTNCGIDARTVSHNFLSRGILMISPKVAQNARKYVVSVWMFSDELRTAMSATDLTAPDSSDCFTDCSGNGYDGIRSATKNGRKCLPWKDSKWAYLHSNVKPNFCTKTDNDIWCPVAYDKWEYCDVPDCASIETATGCVKDTRVSINSSSVFVSWSQPNYADASAGYVVLLHNEDNACEQYAVHLCGSCGNEDSLSMAMKSFFISCKRKSERKISGNACEFADLNQEAAYFVYIIAFSDNSNGADVKRLSVKTKMAVPAAPTNVAISHQDTNNLAFTWNAVVKSNKHGPAASYTTRLISKARLEDRSDVDSNNVKSYPGLDPCTGYCFSVSAANSEGHSPFTELCTNTLAPTPGQVELSEIPTGPGSQRTVSWSYHGDSCSKFYDVYYWTPDNATKRQHMRSLLDATSVDLQGLLSDMLYYVTVVAETAFDTKAGNKTGKESDRKWFYTGIREPRVSNFSYFAYSSMNAVNVSWQMDRASSESIFEYRIQLKDAWKKCLKSVSLTCVGCHAVYSKKYVVQQLTGHNDKTNEIDCPNRENRTFEKGMLQFTIAMESESPLTNYSITLHGWTLLGLWPLTDKSGTMSSTDSSPWYVGLIVAILLLVCVCGAVFYRKKMQKDRKLPGAPSRHLSKRNEGLKMAHCSDFYVDDDPNDISPSSRPPEKDPLPKLEPKRKNNSIPLADFCKVFSRLSAKANHELIQQYKKLAAESKKMEKELGLTVNEGNLEINNKKNRFINILPYDQTRVTIKCKAHPNDYMNANYIPFVDDLDNCEYIASQGPIDGTLGDFWSMIWEQNISCIVMLTRTIEDNKFKCLQYWPENEGASTNFGDDEEFNVTLEEEEEKEGHVERKLQVVNTKTNECRTIHQLHMLTWSDYSAPDVNHFDALLFRFHEIANFCATTPFLIHCSAGVGRTGTLMCIDRIIKGLVNGCQDVNVYDTILNLRRYRNLMVQRQAQYVFIFKYIDHFLKKYMKPSEDEEDTYFNEE